MENKILKFNLSPSSLNTYVDSQITFFYGYILKKAAVDWTPDCYGVAGNVVHNTLEEYGNNFDTDVINLFNAAWDEKSLDTAKGMFGHMLKREKYLAAVVEGKNKLDSVYKIVKAEEKIQIKTKYSNTLLKGIIDVQAILRKDLEIKAESTDGKVKKIILKKGSFVVMDYKTSSSVDKGESFKRQGLFYSFLIWKTKGIIPAATIFEYVKIGKQKAYIFVEKDLVEYEKYLINILDEIYSKKFDISKYELGNYTSPFNGYKSLIDDVARGRNNTKKITLRLKNNKLYYNTTEINSTVIKYLRKRWSYLVDGCCECTKFKSGEWDGYRHFLYASSFPAPFLSDFKKVIISYNTLVKDKNKVKLFITDERNKTVTNAKFNTIYNKSDIVLRYYQEEAKKIIKQNNFYNASIIKGACAIGKTILAAEIIKQENNRTLYLVNRIELAYQTKKALEKYYGFEVGLMSEGNLCTGFQITIAVIQTLSAILKRKDNTKTILQKYLFNVNTLIADECHNVKDSGMYKEISSNARNVSLTVGLSGTPKRRHNDTLCLNSLCGMISYEYTKEQGIADGFLTPDKILFINNNSCNFGVDFNDSYKSNIVEGKIRNEYISSITNKFKSHKKILILTRRVAHAEVLNKLIPDSYIINGGSDKVYRKKMYADFCNLRGTVLIGSVQIFSTGVDIPDLDMIIYALSGKDSNELIQSIGRIHRVSPNKKFGYVIDFNDVGCERLETAVYKRQNMLSEYNYKYNTINIEDIDKYVEK